MSDKLRLGMIGLGEVGFNISKGLKQAGVSQITGYARGPRNKPPYNEAFKRRVQDSGIELATNLQKVALNSDIIFSAVFPKSALDVTREIAPFLSPLQFFFDLNSSSPRDKQAGWAVMNERGVHYVDGVIMSGPLREQHHAQIFAAGIGAEELRDTMNTYGMEIRVVSNNVGDAALLKMIHSIITKGIQALLWESFLALHKAGLEPRVYDGIRNWVDEMGLFARADRLISHSAIHASRRAGEMEFVADTLRSLDITPIMTEATIKRLEWCAQFNFPDYFLDGLPAGYKTVFDVLDKIVEENGERT